MAKRKAKIYKVINGCNTSDDTRYEIGDSYDAANHSAEDTEALLEMGCLEDVDS